MGSVCFPLFSLFLHFADSGVFLGAESKTQWGDTLKQLKNKVDPSSITPTSCLSSWDPPSINATTSSARNSRATFGFETSSSPKRVESPTSPSTRQIRGTEIATSATYPPTFLAVLCVFGNIFQFSALRLTPNLFNFLSRSMGWGSRTKRKKMEEG